MADFDAIVVGSGITGGWAAKELTEAGLRVLMIERGPKIEHGSGYRTETLDPPIKITGGELGLGVTRTVRPRHSNGSPVHACRIT